MADELQVQPPHDREVEIKRIEANSEIQKAALESQKAMHEGWQRVAASVVEAFRSHATESKRVEGRAFCQILVLMGCLFVGVALLTWGKIVPGEGFTFFVGAIVGHLVALSPFPRPIGR